MKIMTEETSYILYYAQTMQYHNTTPLSPRNTVIFKSSASGSGVSVLRVSSGYMVSKQFDRVRWFVDTTRAADASFRATLFLLKDSTVWEIAPKKLISDFCNFSCEPWAHSGPELSENILSEIGTSLQVEFSM